MSQGNVVLWVFTDTATGESWELPINPNTASSPNPQKNLARGGSGVATGDRWASFMTAPEIVTWEFGGVIRSKQQHDLLLSWSQRATALHVTNHLGQTFEVVVESFKPTERQPTPNTPWRMRYTLRSMLLRRVS